MTLSVVKSALVAAAGMGLILGTSLTFVALPAAAVAQAAARATILEAKTAGQVGEQGDGYLGLVTGHAGPDVTAAVSEINAGRRAVYQETAAKTGVTAEAAGQATAEALFKRMPDGQYYKAVGGVWTKK